MHLAFPHKSALQAQRRRRAWLPTSWRVPCHSRRSRVLLHCCGLLQPAAWATGAARAQVQLNAAAAGWMRTTAGKHLGRFPDIWLLGGSNRIHCLTCADAWTFAGRSLLVADGCLNAAMPVTQRLLPNHTRPSSWPARPPLPCDRALPGGPLHADTGLQPVHRRCSRSEMCQRVEPPRNQWVTCAWGCMWSSVWG